MSKAARETNRKHRDWSENRKRFGPEEEEGRGGGGDQCLVASSLEKPTK